MTTPFLARSPRYAARQPCRHAAGLRPEQVPNNFPARRRRLPRMDPRQLTLLAGALDAVAAECVRSPVATLNSGHLRAILVEHFLRAQAALFERGATAAEGRLVRMTGDVIRAEAHVLPARPRGAGRAPRIPDLRLLDPVALGIDVYARGALAPAERDASRLLLDRFAALASGASHALVLACDRRAWDALRVVRPGADARPTELSRLCATLLPASAALTPEPSESTPVLGGQPWGVRALITPMVFGVQRVIAVAWARRIVAAAEPAAPQLDAFVA
jgi:hypothetical protein